MRHSASRKRYGRRKASAVFRRRLLLVPAILLSLVLGIPSGALAYWTSNGGGSGSGTSGSLLAPIATATRTSGTNTIVISWTLPANSGNPTTFHVQRAPATGTSWTDVCGTNATPIAGTSCSNMPSTTGSWRYRVIAHKGSWRATSNETSAVATDFSRPTVTVRKAADQADSTSQPPVRFVVEFSENVTGFDPADLSLSGSVAGGSPAFSVSPPQGPAAVYSVTVTDVSANGSRLVLSVPESRVIDGAGNGNLPSTAADAGVLLDNVKPLRPSKPKLESTTSVDSGVSQSDNITKADQLRFVPSAPLPGTDPGALTVRLHKASSSTDTGSVIATSTIASSATTYSFSEGTTTAPAAVGDWWYWITLTDDFGNVSDPSERQLVVVDRFAAPVSGITHTVEPSGLLGLVPHNRITGDFPSDTATVTAHACARTATSECQSNPQTATYNGGRFVLEYTRGLLSLTGSMSVWITVHDTAGNSSSTVRYNIGGLLG